MRPAKAPIRQISLNSQRNEQTEFRSLAPMGRSTWTLNNNSRLLAPKVVVRKLTYVVNIKRVMLWFVYIARTDSLQTEFWHFIA